MKVKQNKIILENGTKITLDEFIKYKYKLDTDQEISKQQELDIIYEVILQKAYRLIKSHDYTKKKLEKKLEKKYNYPNIIKKVILKLENNGYINDIKYAMDYIMEKKQGSKKVYYDLDKKGISEKDIQTAYKKLKIDEKDYIKTYLKKISKKDIKKQVSYLLRKGFELEDIREVLDYWE
ncbi:MAG: regulatory protein RecX [Fusobacteriota bacterium]